MRAERSDGSWAMGFGFFALPWWGVWVLVVWALAAGAWGTARFVRWKRGNASRAVEVLCGGCGYSLSGHSAEGEVVCPECGRLSVDGADRTAVRASPRVKVATRWAAVLVLVVLPVGLLAREAWTGGLLQLVDHGPLRWVFPWKTGSVARSGEVKAWAGWDRRTWAAHVNVRWRGEMVYAESIPLGEWSVSDGVFGVRPFGAGGNSAVVVRCALPVRGDVQWRTIIVGTRPGGAGELFDSRGAGLTVLGDVDGDGRLEALVDDRSGWEVIDDSGVRAASGVIVQSIGAGGTWGFDATLTRTVNAKRIRGDVAGTLRELLGSETRAYPAETRDHASVALLRVMVVLIYAGESARAYALVDEVWPAGLGGKERFLADFRGALGRSRYTDEIEALGHPKIERSP